MSPLPLSLFLVGGLCKHKDPECDKETSVCADLDGIAVCQCKPGYFKYNKLDHSCRGIVLYTVRWLGLLFNLLVPVQRILCRSTQFLAFLRILRNSAL